MSKENYEIVVGLEVHAQLSTSSKLFSGDSTQYGAEPNTQVSTITLAHPGTLPKLNRKAVEYAIRMGLACGCTITRENYFARKNYFYPDLPKGYQVTQHQTPICTGGTIPIQAGGEERNIKLHHIHLEEDAGKSIHDFNDGYSRIDLNRAGTPLIEIVTEPDLHSGDEAWQFLYEVRRLVRYLGICDGNMEQGSLRCDANVSVRKKGDPALGTRVEVKNLNSFKFLKNAIEYEAGRLIGLLENNEEIIQETRHYDDITGTTSSSREKEEAHDYRYFPEPDIPFFTVDDELVNKIQQQIPRLPAKRETHYRETLGLPAMDSSALADDRAFSDYFESLAEQSKNPKAAANWILGPVRAWMNETGSGIGDFPLLPEKLALVIGLVDEGRISHSTAVNRLLPLLLKETGSEPLALAIANELLKDTDTEALASIIDEVLRNFAAKVEEYRKGKKGLLALFVGEVMKRTKGKADPRMTNELIIKKIKEQQ